MTEFYITGISRRKKAELVHLLLLLERRFPDLRWASDHRPTKWVPLSKEVPTSP
jgi:hypothetical protein